MDERPEDRVNAGNFFDNALQRLSRWRTYLPFGAKRGPAEFDAEESLRLMQACLDGVGGEIAARTRAAELGHLYLSLAQHEKADFLALLTTAFDIDRDALTQATRDYAAEPTVAHYVALQASTQPARVEILKRLNSLPDGFEFLVDLRADLISLLDERPELARLDHDLRGLLDAWFDVGLLTFDRITWDSPASLLERLVAYEAVHQIRSWHDLKNRLGIDRRCYAFFHPKMPDDPLIFVEVALTAGVPESIQALLDEDAPTVAMDDVDTAVFYSISNTQKGLKGIGFGSFLLKRVMEDLSRQVPQLERYVTLSPIPGFRRWLGEVHTAHGDGFLKPAEREQLVGALDAKGLERQFQTLLDAPEWLADPEIADAAREPLLDLCAQYLLLERRGSRPLDPVARFHTTNGASVEQLNFLGDTSADGMRQSFGVMVNYLYSPDNLERNHELLFRKGEVAASGEVKRRAAQRPTRHLQAAVSPVD